MNVSFEEFLLSLNFTINSIKLVNAAVKAAFQAYTPKTVSI